MQLHNIFIRSKKRKSFRVLGTSLLGWSAQSNALHPLYRPSGGRTIAVWCLVLQVMQEAMKSIEKAGHTPDMPFPEDRDMQEGTGRDRFEVLLVWPLVAYHD